MSLNRARHQSIVTPLEPETSTVDVSLPQRNYNKPLINSAMTSGGMSDEEIAKQHQERLYAESLMEVDPPEAAATTIDPQRFEDIDTDAAIARQLQEEEYSRKSFRPFQQTRQTSNNRSNRSTTSNPYGGPSFTDAELAAQLQAEEDQKQRRERPRLTPTSQRRPSQQNDRPEVIPFPLVSPSAARQRPSSATGNHRPAVDLTSLFQLFASPSRPSRGGHRSGDRRNRHLERTTDDFGPDDYENLLELDNSVDKKPLTDDQINRLPVEKYHRRANTNEEDNKCNICWDEFEEDQILRRLRCLHSYHKDCIDRWLKTNNLCPICRIPTN